AKEPAEDPTIGGPQADPVVEKAVAPVRPRLHVCYKKALAADPHVSGGATFDATLGKDGHVASARFVKRDGLNEEMVGCLLTAVKAMTFEPGRKTQIVTLSFGGAGSPAAAKH
ncbi:MAG TPA: AgmX/PglI C-terminal domain-containing protein, partial [Labilithrix sp.]|nr:AgmX/PglI C-terminal domain-containing protein [Labilithrix sp.]